MPNSKKPKIKKSDLQKLFERLKIVREWNEIEKRLIEIAEPLYDKTTLEEIQYIRKMIRIAEAAAPEATQGIKNNSKEGDYLKNLPFEIALEEVRKESVFAAIIGTLAKINHIEVFLDPRAKYGVTDGRTKGKYNLSGERQYVAARNNERERKKREQTKINRAYFESLLKA